MQESDTPLGHARCNRWKEALASLDIYERKSSSTDETTKEVPWTVDTMDDDKRTALHWAAGSRGEEADLLLRKLLRLGPTLETVDGGGMTPLHSACAAGKESTVRILLDTLRERAEEASKGASAAGGQQQQPASSAGKAAVRAWVNFASKQKRTSLHYASSSGNLALVQLLLDSGARVNVADVHGSTPLHRAAGCARADSERVVLAMVEALLDAGADGEAVDAAGDTPLHVAAAENHGEVVKSMLRRGVKNDIQNRDGKYFLHLAPRQLQDELIPIVKEIRGVR